MENKVGNCNVEEQYKHKVNLSVVHLFTNKHVNWNQTSQRSSIALYYGGENTEAISWP